MREKALALILLASSVVLTWMYEREPRRELSVAGGEAHPPAPRAGTLPLPIEPPLRGFEIPSLISTNQYGRSSTPPGVVPTGETPPARPGEPSTEEPPFQVLRSGPATAPLVALTFDDGPHHQITPLVLAELRKREVKATFFVLGGCVKAHPAILRQIVQEGHEIGNHTYSHRLLKSMKTELIQREIVETQTLIREAVGYEPSLFRPPYGSFGAATRELCREHNLNVILWSVDPRDWRIRDEERIYQAVTSHTQNGSIILCHDIYRATLQALPRILDTLLEGGYRFVTVSELCGLNPIRPDNPSPENTPQARAR